MQDEGMDKVAERNTKITTIISKMDYLFTSAAKNRKLSLDIRGKLLGQESQKEPECEEKAPKEQGQLNQIIDALQGILDTINTSNAHLVSVNKEI